MDRTQPATSRYRPSSGAATILGRARRTLTRVRYRALYRDTLGGYERSMLVAGTARSGTTWLAGIIASQLECRILFEPFQPRKVRAYRPFAYFQYLRPERDHQEMSAFCDAVFSGRIRSRWIDQEVGPLRPPRRLVKEIRANLLLAWIARRYPQVPQLFIIRHPCAVVLSRLQLNWATDSDLASFLAQPDLVEDFLADQIDLIHRTRTDSGKHALIWCISNAIPLRQFDAGGLPLVFYEHLRDQPEQEIPRIFSLLGQPYRESVFEAIVVPSSTTRARPPLSASAAVAQAPTWQRQLTREQVTEILAIVDAFGLSHLYGESSRPLVSLATPALR